MKPELFREIALIPAIDLLPVSMGSPAAQAMVIAICLQESGLINRRQIDGPARGYAQFERGGGVIGVLTHASSKSHALDVCKKLDYPPTIAAVYEAIEHNDVLMAAFARLLLWTLPGTLPNQTETDKGYKQYIAAWRPGKPHPEFWPKNFQLAWSVVL